MPGIAPVRKWTGGAIGNANVNARVASVTTPATGQAGAAVVGDWLVAVASHDWGKASQLPAPGGTAGTWTRRALGNTGEVNQVHSGVWIRQVTAAGAQTVTSSGATTSSDVCLQVIILDKDTVDATDPFDVGDGTANGGASAQSAHVAPSVDPADDNIDGLLLTVHSAQKNVVYDVPTGMTQVGTQLVSQTFVTQLVSALALTGAATEAATGTKTATSRVAAGGALSATGYAAVSVAIKGRASTATPTYTSSKTARPSVGTVPPPGFAVSYGLAVNGDRIELAATNNGSGTSYSGLKTTEQNVGNLTLDAVWLEVIGLPVAQAGQTQGSPGMLWLRAASQPDSTRIGFEFDPRAGILNLASQVNYGDGAATQLRFDPLWHRWWKIAPSGGNILWQTSRDGTTWATRRTMTAPAWTAGADLSWSVETYRTDGVSDSFDIRSLCLAPDRPPPRGDVLSALLLAA